MTMQNPAAYSPYISPNQFQMQPTAAHQMTALQGLDSATAAQIANSQQMASMHMAGTTTGPGVSASQPKPPRPDRIEVYSINP